jgi:hypothetical protein
MKQDQPSIEDLHRAEAEAKQVVDRALKTFRDTRLDYDLASADNKGRLFSLPNSLKRTSTVLSEKGSQENQDSAFETRKIPHYLTPAS